MLIEGQTIKPSEYRKIYLASLRLYGLLFVPELFDLLKHYQIGFKKSDVYDDLESRLEKSTRGYYVVKGKAKEYLIIRPYITDEWLNKLLESKPGKPHYYPKTFTDFLKYSDPEYLDENDQIAVRNIRKFLTEHCTIEEDKLTNITEWLLSSFRHEKIDEVISHLAYFSIDLRDEKDLEKFMFMAMSVANNIRTPLNNGFTPKEMTKNLGPLDLEHVQLTIGPNMRKSMLDGDIDPVEYLKEIEMADFPLMAKQSLRKELLEIIDQIKHKAKMS